MNDQQFLLTATISQPLAVIDIYHKGCLNCEGTPELQNKLAHLMAFAAARKTRLRVNFKRTELSPEYHKAAAKIFGSEYYPPVAMVMMATADFSGRVTTKSKSLTLDDLCVRIMRGGTISGIMATD